MGGKAIVTDRKLVEGQETKGRAGQLLLRNTRFTGEVPEGLGRDWCYSACPSVT